MHRFAVPDLFVAGHDPSILAERLEYLRRHRYCLMDLRELLKHVDEGIPLKKNAVVFTVDDGYADFVEVGAPVFAAYDCPVTVFLVTDFVSGTLWNWFDRVEWAFGNSKRGGIDIEINGKSLMFRWTDEAQRARACLMVIEALKRIPDREKEDSIVLLSRLLEVAIPESAPEKYRAMSWQQVRACGTKGVTFGPHTLSHPILTQVDPVRADREISASWRAVSASTDAAVPVFCYPNGTALDFSPRDKESVARAGMTAALSTMDGSLESTATGLEVDDRYSIPRFAYSEERSALVQIASGLEQRKTRIRRRLG